MKKIFITIAILMGFSIGSIYAETYVTTNCTALNVSTYKAQIDLRQKSFLTDQEKNCNRFARRGCCSWHKGVCGCSRGKTTCCDGTVSPTCSC